MTRWLRQVLKSYEKKDQMLVAHAATNLSFIYFHEVASRLEHTPTASMNLPFAPDEIPIGP